MTNFKVERDHIILNQPYRRVSIPSRHYMNLRLLESEGVDIIRTFKGKGWIAFLIARVTSPSLVLRIMHPVTQAEKELGDGLRLRAFIAMSAMSGKDEGDEIGEYLCDIWDERDFASNSNAEITDGNEEV
jgi:hypothetical protein